jgi:hypothetical protein
LINVDLYLFAALDEAERAEFGGNFKRLVSFHFQVFQTAKASFLSATNIFHYWKHGGRIFQF